MINGKGARGKVLGGWESCVINGKGARGKVLGGWGSCVRVANHRPNTQFISCLFTFGCV